MLTQKIICNFLNTTPSGYIIFRQGEIGREIEFTITDEDGYPVTLTGYDVQFSMFKPDGNFVIATAVVNDTKATVTQTEQMSAVSGVGYFDLKCAKEGEVIYTFNGFVQIDTPIIDTEIVESVSEVNGFVFPDDFQTKLIAGENITIENNVISAEVGDSVTITPTQLSGKKIADFTIGENKGSLYAPDNEVIYSSTPHKIGKYLNKDLYEVTFSLTTKSSGYTELDIPTGAVIRDYNAILYNSTTYVKANYAYAFVLHIEGKNLVFASMESWAINKPFDITIRYTLD